MKIRKRIGVLMTEINFSLTKKQINGIYQQASRLGYDVLVFTHFTSNGSSDSLQAILGEENIYSLLPYADLDGIILIGNRYHREGLLHRLETLIQTIGIPAVAYDYPSQHFPSILPDNCDQFFSITEHLITVHHCKNILCLAGPAGERNSEERLKGFRKALLQYNLPCTENNIIYGDYWDIIPRKVGADIAAGAIPMPDAVACANDVMAIHLTTELMRHGIRVPEHILITGFDGIEYTERCVPSITTIANNEYNLGALAVQRLAQLMKCPDISALPTQSCIHQGSSCGCNGNLSDMIVHNMQSIQNGFHWERIVNSNLWLELNNAVTVQSCMEILGKNIVCLHDPHKYYICLCEDWMGNIEDEMDYRKKGYSQQMHQRLYHHSWEEADCTDVPFPLAKLLPALYEEHEPEFFIFTPINFRDRIFGYSVLRYENAEETYHDFYKQHNNMLSVSLEQIRNLEYQRHLQKLLEGYSIRDSLTGLYNQKGILQFFSKNSKKEELTIILLSLENIQELSQQHLKNEQRILITVAHEINRSLPINSFCGKLTHDLFAIFGWQMNTAKTIETIDIICRDIKNMLQHELSISTAPSFFCESVVFSVTENFSLETELHQLIQKINNDNKPHALHHPYWDQFKEIHYAIHMHPETAHQVEQYSNALGLSRSHFQRLYTEQFGISCKRDIIRSKTERAKYYLKSTHLSINEIADKCGYDSTTYFMKQFKAETGMTALQYRNTMTA